MPRIWAYALPHPRVNQNNQSGGTALSLLQNHVEGSFSGLYSAPGTSYAALALITPVLSGNLLVQLIAPYSYSGLELGQPIFNISTVTGTFVISNPAASTPGIYTGTSPGGFTVTGGTVTNFARMTPQGVPLEETASWTGIIPLGSSFVGSLVGILFAVDSTATNGDPTFGTSKLSVLEVG